VDALDDISIKRRTLTTTKTVSPPSPSSSSPLIDVIHAGTQVPQEALVEMNTRAAYFLDELDWNELYPQMALAQVPALHVGVHNRGTFTDVYEWQLEEPRAAEAAGAKVPDISAQRRETAAHIVRLASLLEDVQKIAIGRGPGPAGSFSLVCEDGKLRVYGRNKAKNCLPPDVMTRFEAHAEA